MKTTTQDTIVTATVKAFSGDRSAAEHRLSVSADGTVRVWDDVAGYYTTCHSLSSRTQARIRKLAASR